jgi:hypothetical protein
VETRCADDPRSPAPDTVPDETADRKSLRSERTSISLTVRYLSEGGRSRTPQ